LAVFIGLTFLAGVTIHGGANPLSYAWRCIRECDFKIPLNRLDFRLVHPPVNKPVAIGTNAAKVAGGVRHRHKFRHVSGWCFWRSAWQTIDMAGWTGLLCGLAATLKKSHEHRPMKERRSLSINRPKTLLHPCTDRVFVNVKKAGYLFHGIRAMKLHKPWIGVALAATPHTATEVERRGAPMRACAHASKSAGR
jgi:hypothetical protein